MLKNRVTIVSLVIICFAVAVYYLSKGGAVKQNSRFHTFINPEGIKQIAIEQGEKTIKLNSHDNRWFITDSHALEIAVESSKILPIFEFINDGRIVQRITKKESAYPNFDVTGGQAIKVVLQGKEKEQLIFYIGKQKDYASQFARKEADPYVYLISERLNLSLDPETWFFKKVLDYDFTMLDHINYTCSDNKTLTLDYDKKADQLTIKETPEGKQAKDLQKLKNDFTKISVTKYLPRPQKIEISPVVAHTLSFKGEVSVILTFLKATEEKSNKHYLDITVKGEPKLDKDLQYTKKISGQYVFELSWFDKKKFQREYDDFFEEKIKETSDAAKKDTAVSAAQKSESNDTPVSKEVTGPKKKDK